MDTKPFATIGIIGAGTMGAQIALLCATHGYQVRLFSRSEQTLQKAAQNHSQVLEQQLQNQQITAKEKTEISDRIRLTTNMQEAATQADLVIENAPELLDLKRELFAQLDELCPAHTILATNSSSLFISEIEDATQRREKVLNLHFVTPVVDDSLVELMRGTLTSDDTMTHVHQFTRSLALIPFFIRKESRGFLLGRVWNALKQESLHVVDKGVASPEEVDRAWMIATNMAIGPFGLMDVIGLDVIRDVDLHRYRRSGHKRDAPPQVLLDKIKQGELGIKTGKGFYTYPNPAFHNPNWLHGDEG